MGKSDYVVGNNITSVLDHRRRDLKLSVEVVAKAMGISRQSYYAALKSENGFNDRQILRACSVLECKVVFSFGESVWVEPVKGGSSSWKDKLKK